MELEEPERSLSRFVERVRAPKMAEMIASSLRRLVVRGELAEGEALPSEAALMEQFGVSRPTLREALRVLESESLVTIRRGARGGARVTPPDQAVAARFTALLLEYRGTTLRDLFEARSQIEPPAAALAAQRRSEASLTQLRSLYDAISEAEDIRDRIVLHTHFDAALVRASGNQTMILMSAVVRSIIDAVTVESVLATLDDEATGRAYREAHRAQARLIDLIEQGDADRAAGHWKRHLDLAQTFVFSTGVSAKTVLDLL